jgi:hypothetical protein
MSEHAVATGESTSPRRVYLHVGAPKTGTTYLQMMLDAHRDQLLEDGCFYPKTRGSAHHVEARDLRNARPRQGYVHPAGPGSWDRLARIVTEWDGPGHILLSSELLVFANPAHARRAIRSLQPAELHLVVTVRDLVRQIPAVWQERIKNGSTIDYEEFLRRLAENDDRGVWNAQDPVRIVERWAQGIPAEHVHLVTVPPPGSDPRLLWTRFAQVIGVDADAYASVPKGANTSLGVAETEVVRRINAQVEKAPWQFYSKHIKVGIAQGVLAGRSDGPRLVLPEEMLPLVERRTKRIVDTIAERGYDLVGDLGDLLPSADGRGVGRVPEPDVARLADASSAAADYLAKTAAQQWTRARKAQTAETGQPATRAARTASANQTAKQAARRTARKAATKAVPPSARVRARRLLRRAYDSLRRRLRG